MLSNAWPIRPLSLRSHCTCEPSPNGTPVTRASTTPPSVSPSRFATLIASIIASPAAASAQRTGDASTACQSISGPRQASTSPIRATWL